MRDTRQAGRGGRYDEICERLSLDLKASAVVLIVKNGRHGNGMSVALDPKGGHTGMLTGGPELAELLRRMADLLDEGAGPTGVRVTTTDEDAS